MLPQFIIYNIVSLNTKYDIKTNNAYILKERNTSFYNEIENILDYQIQFHVIDNPNDKEWCIFIYLPEDTSLSLLDIIKLKHTISYISIGYNIDTMKNNEIRCNYYINMVY